jgi:PAS domain S-box-containing protein
MSLPFHHPVVVRPGNPCKDCLGRALSLLSFRALFNRLSSFRERSLVFITGTSGAGDLAKHVAQQLKAVGGINKWYIIGLVTAVIVEALLIAWLMVLGVRRRQAEAESRRLAEIANAERKQLNDVLSNVPGIVWEAKIDEVENARRTTFVSNYVEKMLGYSPEEWMAAPSGIGLSLMPEPDDRLVAQQTSEAVIASGREGISQFRWRAKDGRLVWAETYLNPILNDQGKTVGLRGVTIDITQRKLAEESLRESEDKNRAILAAIPDLMFLQSRDGVYLDYHAKDGKDLLVPPEVFLGKNMGDILPPDLASRFFEAFKRAEETNEPQIVEYNLEIDTIDRCFEARIVRSGDDILSMVRDITERKAIEQAIKRQEAQLAGIIGSAMDGIITIDEDQRILLFNQAAEKIFGWPASEAIGQSIEEFIPERFRGGHRAQVHDFGAKDVSQRVIRERSRDLYGLTRSGREFPMEASISQIELNGQKFFTVILRDISDRRVAEAALKESELSYRSIFNAANDAIFVHELETGRIIDVNERMCELYGYKQDEVRQLTVADLSSNEAPYTQKDAVALIQKAGAGQPQIFDWHARKMSGELFWVEVSLRQVSLRGTACLLAVVRDITERKQAETQLAQSHRQVNEVLESIGDAFYSVDSQLRFTYVNRKTEELWATKREDLLGRNFLEVFPQAAGTPQYYECMRAMNEGSIISFEAISPILNRWVEVSAYPTAAGLSVYFRDITERRAAQRALQESEERLLLAHQASRMGAFEWNMQTGVNTWSKELEEMYGLPLGSFGRTQTAWAELVHPEDRSRAEAVVQQAIETNTPVEGEWRVKWPDGSIHWIFGRFQVFKDASGQPLKLTGINIDITERMLAQQAIEESEARFRNLSDTAPVMIWVVDENQACTYVNKQFLLFTGRTLEQELGFGWADDIHPDDLKQTMETYTTAFQKQVPMELELRIRRADGKYRWLVASNTPRFSSNGTFLGYIGTGVDFTERKESEAALRTAHEQLQRLKNQLEAENIYLQEELQEDQAFGDMVGQSAPIKYVLHKISQVAPTDSIVLVTGETGTGKELVAHAIHAGSRRKDRPLIRVNCAALSASLIESELFGHEKGAFTGAAARKLGRFEVANGGTLLLDEIGELPLDLQSKLLRVLQDGEFERVGGTKTVRVDVRIIAATNRDLKQDVEKHRFREDLWYRLNVFPITTPPLRDRPDDIPLLVDHFVRRFARKFGKPITAVSPASMEQLCKYSWPGNIRELANVIERAVINSRGTVLRIGEEFLSSEGESLAAPVKTLAEMERDYILRTLQDLRWRIDGPQGAARVLGINPSTLRTRMGKLGIHKPNGKSFGAA